MVVSNIFYFHPYLGKIPILTNIFQRGWNHQLDLGWNLKQSCFNVNYPDQPFVVYESGDSEI